MALGKEAQSHYEIIIDNPKKVAVTLRDGIAEVREFRKTNGDAYYFNWLLHIDEEFQKPFRPTHENMRNLNLHRDQKHHFLAANLRRAFSGIVAGNVKDEGIRAIEQHGMFEIRGDAELMKAMDQLLQSFVKQSRMKLPGTVYSPCYKIIR